MLTGSGRQILPVTSDSSAFYVALQPKNSGTTSYDYVGTGLTYTASTGVLAVAGTVSATTFTYANGTVFSGGGGGSSAQGATGQIQYNNGGVLGASTLYYYSGNTNLVATGNISVVGNIIISNTNTSTSTTSGALQVSGGVGIGGNLYVGGNLSIAGNTTFVNTQTITTTDTIAAPAINAGTIGNSGANFAGSSATFTGFTQLGGPSNILSANTQITGNLIVGGNGSNADPQFSGTVGARMAIVGNSAQGTGTALAIAYANATSTVLAFAINPQPNQSWIMYDRVGNVWNAGLTQSSGNVLPASNATINLGSVGAYWNNVYGVTFTGTSTTAKYADLAEMYHADDYYTPGTVMVFGGVLDVTVSTQSHDTSVAGVVSTNPAYLMNDNFEQDNWVPVALTGRVPCMVRGPVAKGTLLVSSEIKGVACAMDKSLYEPGCIIGKSMDIISDNSIRKIEIAVGRF